MNWDLTRVEKETLEAYAAGMSTRQIAAARVRSIHTIDTARKRAMMKLDARTVTQAVAIAIRKGAIQPPARPRDEEEAA